MKNKLKSMKSVHLLIKGKVQGVFYRVEAKKMADDLRLAGWVKNTANGNVEITVCGSNNALQQFVNWCRQGPPLADVSAVEVTETNMTGFSRFEIIREL